MNKVISIINNIIYSFIATCDIKVNKVYLQYFANYQVGFYKESLDL